MHWTWVLKKYCLFHYCRKFLPKLDQLLRTFFHKSNIATEVLQEKQLALQLQKQKVINDCKTRDGTQPIKCWRGFWNKGQLFLQLLLMLELKRMTKPELLMGWQIKKSNAVRNLFLSWGLCWLQLWFCVRKRHKLQGLFYHSSINC